MPLAIFHTQIAYFGYIIDNCNLVVRSRFGGILVVSVASDIAKLAKVANQLSQCGNASSGLPAHVT